MSRLAIARFALAVMVWTVMVLAAATVLGAPPTDGDLKYSDWFRSLTNSHGYGCCSIADCRRLKSGQWRVTESGYEIFMADEWVHVPDEAILQNQPNPTGDTVACFNALAHVVYCFVRAVEA